MWLQGAVYRRAKQHITVRHPDWNTGCSDVCDLLLKRITAISSHTTSFWGEVKETWQQQIGFTCAPNCIFKSKAFCGQNSVWGHCFLCSGLCFFPSRLFVYSFRCITPEKKAFINAAWHVPLRGIINVLQYMWKEFVPVALAQRQWWMDLKVRGKEQYYDTVYDVKWTAHSNITLLIQSFGHHVWYCSKTTDIIIIYIITELLFVCVSVMYYVFFLCVIHLSENKMIRAIKIHLGKE